MKKRISAKNCTKPALKFALLGKVFLPQMNPTQLLAKKFDKLGIPNEEETRRTYREMLFTAPEVEKYICGVIFFKETATQKSKDGIPFP